MTDGRTTPSPAQYPPRYMRRVPSLDNLIPILYLKGISTGDFTDALSVNAKGLSTSTVVRLKPSGSRNTRNGQNAISPASVTSIFWEDGIYFNGRLAREAYLDPSEQCCWVQKTANILVRMPKSIQPKAKEKIHDIYFSPTKEQALVAYISFFSLHGKNSWRSANV